MCARETGKWSARYLINVRPNSLSHIHMYAFCKPMLNTHTQKKITTQQLSQQTNKQTNKKKLHLLNALFIDPTPDLWIGMYAIDETAVEIIGLDQQKKNDCTAMHFFVQSVSLWVFVWRSVVFILFFHVRSDLECWTIIVILWQTTLAKRKENITNETKHKHTKADHLHFRWGCQCDVCCNVVIHCDSHTSSHSFSFYLGSGRADETGRTTTTETNEKKSHLYLMLMRARVSKPMPVKH